jgi:hypothetical protein
MSQSLTHILKFNCPQLKLNQCAMSTEEYHNMSKMSNMSQTELQNQNLC